MAVSLLHSPLESARFGLRVYRATVDALDADALIDAIERERVDVAIVRVPPESLGAIETLRQRGLAPIVADTLVHYDVDLRAVAPRTTEGEPVVLRTATHADASLLESVCRQIFKGYVTHYHANPLLSPAKILEGYVEWASSFVSMKDGGNAWLIESGGNIAGFSCYRIDETAGIAIGALNGVLPARRGRGIYRRMLQQMLAHFRNLGIPRFAIATQVQNLAVQRIWAAEGLTLRRADNTVHINALCAVANAAATPGETSPHRSRVREPVAASVSAKGSSK